MQLSAQKPAPAMPVWTRATPPAFSPREGEIRAQVLAPTGTLPPRKLRCLSRSLMSRRFANHLPMSETEIEFSASNKEEEPHSRAGCATPSQCAAKSAMPQVRCSIISSF